MFEGNARAVRGAVAANAVVVVLNRHHREDPDEQVPLQPGGDVAGGHGRRLLGVVPHEHRHVHRGEARPHRVGEPGGVLKTEKWP